MAERHVALAMRGRLATRGRLAMRGWLSTVALLVLVALAVPGAAFGHEVATGPGSEIHLAAVPDPERCADESPDPDTGQKLCEGGTGGIGGGLPSWAGTVLIGVVGAGVLALVAAYLILRRRAGLPAAPADPTEWWTCPNCRATNVIDSPRCYSCGTWRG